MSVEFAVAIALVTAGLIALLWAQRRRRSLKRRSEFVASTRRGADPDSKTKRRLDTALRELRDLREALPPAERILVERRKNSTGPPDGLERRKGRRCV